MKFSISTIALAIFMTSASSILATQSAYAEDETPILVDDSGMGGGEDTIAVDETEGLNPYDPIINEDGTVSCRDCEVEVSDDGIDPEIYQTSGGPEVQRENNVAAKPKTGAIEISHSDEGVPFHEIMRKKRRAARSN